MYLKYIFYRILIFLTVQHGYYFKPASQAIGSLSAQTTSSSLMQRKIYFPNSRSTDSGTSSAEIPLENEELFRKESILKFVPKSSGKVFFRKNNFPEKEKRRINKIGFSDRKNSQDLRHSPDRTGRYKRSVDIPKERNISSHISLKTTGNTVRVDFSGDSVEQYEGSGLLECGFISDENRRLIENLVDAINCGSFPLVNNGRFELFLGDLDGDIEPQIKCDRYYMRHGKPNGGLVCQDGKWSFNASCELVRCTEKLEAPLNGQNISITGNQFNDTATFSCLYGYELVGDKVMTCGEDGEWTGKIPTCSLVQCSNVTAPEYGYVSNVIDIDMDFNQTFLFQPDFNSTIKYYCQEGYTLVGRSESTCKADGRWSHRKVPKCKKVCLVPFSKRLASIVWLQPYMNPLDVRTEFQFGQEIIYLCRKRYKSHNDGGAMCVDGKWDPPIKCQRIYSCRSPRPPKHGRIVHEINRSFVQFTCDYGYQISGSDTHTCLPNGTWSGEKPMCRKMCRMPRVFAMQDAWLSLQFRKFQQDNQLLVGSSIEYSCKNGYQKAVNVSSTCDDGNWIPKPRCISSIVRLTGSKREEEGLVEVYVNGKWGLVCDHLFVTSGVWGDNESKIVCKMLGYAIGNKEEAANYKRITEHVIYQSVSCSGDEQNLLQCGTTRAKVWCNRFVAVKCFKGKRKH